METKRKVCSRCRSNRPVDAFGKSNQTVDGIRPYCDHCHRMASMKCYYKITETQLRDLLDAQQGTCKICGCDFGEDQQMRLNATREYHVDHDHATGRVRGLLCATCNTLVGCVEKRNVNPLKITEYLR